MIYLELFLIFFKIGAFTFGGGYAMLPLIQQEMLSHNWMDLEQLVNFVAVSESTPGPLAVNLASFVGAETGGLLGAGCATTGVCCPLSSSSCWWRSFTGPSRPTPLSKAV